MNLQRSVGLGLALLFAPHAAAQSVYIDFAGATPPSSSYAAAAGVAGHWNAMPFPCSNQALVDTQGQATSLVFSASSFGMCPPESIDHPTTTGDDERLLDDWYSGDCFANPTEVTVGPFAPGIYQLFVYPSCVGGSITSFDVTNDTGAMLAGLAAPAQDPFPGTYAGWIVPTAPLYLSAASTTLTMKFTSGFAQGVSGIQLVRMGSFESFCFGDAQLCPCNNPGDPGHGCANLAFTSGALLTATGTSSVSADTLTLNATSMSSLQSWYFQGTATDQAPFGYGIQCLSGTVVRVGMKSVAAGASSNPSGADLPLSIKGGIPAVGATRHYQVAYRQANPPCVPTPISNTNRTNGMTVVWTP